jgi:hypothetical protein
MVEEFEVDDRVRIIKGKHKGKTGRIVSSGQTSWEMRKREGENELPWEESGKIPFWFVRLEDTDKTLPFTKDQLKKMS